MQISIKSDLDRLLKQNKQAQAEIKKAAVTALNKTVKAVESRAVKKISADTGIKPQRKVRERLVMIKAQRNQLIAKLIAHPKGINLIEFVQQAKRNPQSFRQKNKNGFKSSGVIANAWNERKTYKGTFIGRGKNSGKMLVYSREDYSNNRSPIKTIKGPSIPNTFIQKRVMDIMKAVAQYQWRKNIDHEVKYRLSKIKT